MKKIHSVARPFLALIFGSLLLLLDLNGLQSTGAGLALAIIGIIFAIYYLVAGLLGLIVNEKMPQKGRQTLEVIAVSLFPVYLFVGTLMIVIANAQTMGPTGWIINILSLAAFLMFVIFYLLGIFVDNKVIKKLVFLFAAIMGLAFILSFVFDINGNQVIIGNLPIASLAMYAVYGNILIGGVMRLGKDEQKAEEPPVREE